MKTILVVDDNKINLAMARNVLSDTYNVVPLLKGEQALVFLENNSCDLVLLDIMMPEMDGFEVYGKLRKIPGCENLPVIFLTADNNVDTETRCFNEGAVDFITKPFIAEVMISRISRALELEDLRKSLTNKLNQKIKEVSDIKKSDKDALTGLWNRAYTEKMVNTILENGGKGTLFMIDMDNFKAINDNFGHLAGDETLKMFADTMKEFSKSDDILCRIGGDEFIMFIKDTVSRSEISNLATDMIQNLVEKIQAKKFDTNTSVSIGISQAPQDAETFEKLYSNGDKALYYVKQNGKNSFHFYADNIREDSERTGRTVDINYLREVMNRADSGRGAYLMDIEAFPHVYRFIRRFVERSDREIQTVLFTVQNDEESSKMDLALSLLEKSIYTSLRRSDICTRYSGKQIVVILLNANEEDGIAISERIIDHFNQLYEGRHPEIVYDIAAFDRTELAGKKVIIKGGEN